MIVNAGYRGKVGAAVPKFTYTGQYNVRKDGVVELLTSGTIVFLEPKVIDVFLVGGGGMGGFSGTTDSSITYAANGGGGGGYTRTVRRVNAQGTYQITIGEGSRAPNTDGGSSAWGTVFTVPGGASAGNLSTVPTSSTGQGHPGGSGGGGCVISNSDYGTGGSDGSNGEQGFYRSAINGGKGQNFTTREFGEASGKLYAGGGGGGRAMQSNTPVISAGGSGGGGAGGFQWLANKLYQAAGAGGANTGGGGGGSVGSYNVGMTGGSGGSGIVCFREARGLPELAGTWVLNKRVYYTETFEENLNNASVIDTSGTERNVSIFSIGTAQIRFIDGNNAYLYYNNSTNTWNSTYPTVIFKDGATASDKFRAWLASNATKQ